MGFCLFEHAYTPGIYFAVNPAHVIEIEEVQDESAPLCRLVFEHRLEAFDPVVSAACQAVQSLLMQASKIGVNKADFHVLGGRDTLRPAPLLFQNAPNVLLVRELLDHEFPNGDGSFVTASTLLMTDGKTRLIVERPGVFVRGVNAGGQVFMLDEQ